MVFQEYMKAYQIVENGKPLEKREIKKPIPVGEEILIKTIACGVCHSDVHIHEGFFSLGEGGLVGLISIGIILYLIQRA